MANVLIYTLVFPPDGVSTGQIMGELAVDLERAGHRVSVVTTQPHYNFDEEARRAQPLAPMWGGLLYRSEFHGIPVLHTRMPPKGKRIRNRLFGWLLFHALGLIVALRFFRRSQVVIIPSPLLSAGVVGWLFGLVTGARYVYNVQELYPDLGIQLGRLRNPVVIRLLRSLEGFVYRTAAALTVITHGMREKILGRGVSAGKVHYVPNFVDVDDLSPGPHENGFSKEHGLSGRFVVTYAGNMGYAQGLEVLLEAAERLRARTDILFLFVGGGVARGELAARAAAGRLTNVRFVEHQPYSRVPEIYAASDFCAVPLLDTIAADAVPSKVYRIMACARPLLAIASERSELAAIVRESGGGLVVPPDAGVLAAAVSRYADLSEAERERHGRAGRAYALREVSRPIITSRYSDLVSALTSDVRRASAS